MSIRAPRIKRPSANSPNRRIRTPFIRKSMVTSKRFGFANRVEREHLLKEKSDLMIEIRELQGEVEQLKKAVESQVSQSKEEAEVDIIVAQKSGDTDTALVHQRLQRYQPELVKWQKELAESDAKIAELQKLQGDDNIRKLRKEIALHKQSVSSEREDLRRVVAELKEKKEQLNDASLHDRMKEMGENQPRIADLESVLRDLVSEGKRMEEECRRKEDGTEKREKEEAQIREMEEKYESLRQTRLQKQQQLKKLKNEKATRRSLKKIAADMKIYTEHSIFQYENLRKRREPPSQSDARPCNVSAKSERHVTFVIDAEEQGRDFGLDDGFEDD